MDNAYATVFCPVLILQHCRMDGPNITYSCPNLNDGKPCEGQPKYDQKFCGECGHRLSQEYWTGSVLLLNIMLGNLYRHYSKVCGVITIISK